MEWFLACRIDRLYILPSSDLRNIHSHIFRSKSRLCDSDIFYTLQLLYRKNLGLSDRCYCCKSISDNAHRELVDCQRNSCYTFGNSILHSQDDTCKRRHIACKWNCWESKNIPTRNIDQSLLLLGIGKACKGCWLLIADYRKSLFCTFHNLDRKCCQNNRCIHPSSRRKCWHVHCTDKAGNSGSHNNLANICHKFHHRRWRCRDIDRFFRRKDSIWTQVDCNCKVDNLEDQIRKIRARSDRIFYP